MISALSEKSRRDGFFDFLRRNRYLIAGVGGLVFAFMLVYTIAVYRPVYASKAVVIIKDSAITSRYVETEQYYALQTTSSSSSNPVLNTMGILKSGAISDAVYDYFRARRPEELRRNKIGDRKDWDRFFGDGSGFIQAKNQPGTDLITIRFSWREKTIARDALAAVVKAFQAASRDLNQEEQVNRTKFLESKVREIEKQVAAIRKEKSEYQSRQGTVSVQREGSDLAGTRLELANRLNQLESQARGKEDASRRYQQMLGMGAEKALAATALGQNGTLARLQDELYRLEQQASQLGASLTDANPKVQEVKAQIAQVKANIAAEKARTIGKAPDAARVVADTNRAKLVDAMLTAQAEAQELRTQAASVRARLSQVDRQLKDFPEMAEGLANIEQKEASLSLALDNLRKKALEGKLKEAQTLSNVFVVDAPRLPDKPEFPTQLHLLALSVLLGVGAGLAAAFGKEQFLSSGGRELPEWMAPLEDEPVVMPARPEAPALAPALATQAGPVLAPVIAAKKAGSTSTPTVSAQAGPASGPQAEATPEPAASVQPGDDWTEAAPVPIEAASDPEPAGRPVPSIGEIVSVAGPMARNGKYRQPHAIRLDLLQPLPKPKTAVVPSNAAVDGKETPASPSVQAAQGIPETPVENAPIRTGLSSGIIDDSDLLPPGIAGLNPPAYAEASDPGQEAVVDTSRTLPIGEMTPAPTSESEVAMEATMPQAASLTDQSPTSRVRQSAPGDPMLLDRLRQAQRAAVSTRGIPMLHAAPPAGTVPIQTVLRPANHEAPASQVEAATTHTSHASKAAAIGEAEPEARRRIRQPLPLAGATKDSTRRPDPPAADRRPETAQKPRHTDHMLEPGGEKRLSVEDMVNLVQESLQQPSAPEARRRRQLPAFLLDGNKQVLSADDDLFADVAPMSAPADEAVLAEQRPPVGAARENSRRSPLKVSSLWFRKQPNRHPEAYFGMERRKDGAGLERRKNGEPFTGPHAG